MTIHEFYSDIFADKEKLTDEVFESYANFFATSIPASQTNNFKQILEKIVVSLEEDLYRDSLHKRNNFRNISQTIQSVSQESLGLITTLPQYITILSSIRRVIFNKAATLTRKEKSNIDLIVNLMNIFDQLVAHLCKKSDIERSKKNIHDKSIIGNLKIVKNDLQKQLDSIYQFVKKTPIGLAGCDSDLNVKLWNPVAASMTGYQQNDIIGKNILNIFSVPSKKVLMEYIQKKQQRIKRIKLNIQIRDGGIFNAFVLINSLKSEFKQNINYIISFVDMRKDEELKTQMKKIDQLGAVTRLSDAIMHDIRNPINSLALNIDVLTQLTINKYENNTEINSIIERINRQINNLTQSLNHYIGFSKIIEFQQELVDINELLNELILDTRYIFTDKNISIKFKQPRNRQIINGDKSLLLRVFRNLLDNAVDAIENSGSIEIIVKKRNKNIHISIVDNGKGIHSDNLKNIFRPYFTNKVKGTGLGLFTVREIVHSHKGRIYCSSEINKGSRFMVSLPVVIE